MIFSDYNKLNITFCGMMGAVKSLIGRKFAKIINYNFLDTDSLIEKKTGKSINQIFNDSGWHFNNILTPEDISLKLRTFAHSEFADKKFSSINVIEKKMKKKIDLFDRGHKYQKVEIDNSYPEYLTKNLDEFKDFII